MKRRSLLFPSAFTSVRVRAPEIINEDVLLFLPEGAGPARRTRSATGFYARIEPIWTYKKGMVKNEDVGIIRRRPGYGSRFCRV